MIVNTGKCVGCGMCVPYCVVGAIKIENRKAVIDQENCVECGSCFKVGVCRKDAIEMPELSWPRILRREYSDVDAEHPKTKLGGRGTYEVKTNDVTGRIRSGNIGLVVEMGRPGLGTYFSDVQKMTRALAPLGIEFEESNPLSSLFDHNTGDFNPEILNEKVLSCIIEMKMPVSRLEEAIKAVLATAPSLDTVFSMAFLSAYAPDGSLPGMDVVKKLGIEPRPNAKFNLGMGRPLYHDPEEGK